MKRTRKMVSTINCPCKDCEEREINCHQDCKKYKQFKAIVKQYKKRYGDYIGSGINE